MKKFVDVVSDREIHKLLPSVDEGLWDGFWEMWRDDLSINMPKPDLLRNANGILIYFGSDARVTDVDWDMQGCCFLWEVEGNESTT